MKLSSQIKNISKIVLLTGLLSFSGHIGEVIAQKVKTEKQQEKQAISVEKICADKSKCKYYQKILGVELKNAMDKGMVGAVNLFTKPINNEIELNYIIIKGEEIATEMTKKIETYGNGKNKCIIDYMLYIDDLCQKILTKEENNTIQINKKMLEK